MLNPACRKVAATSTASSLADFPPFLRFLALFELSSSASSGAIRPAMDRQYAPYFSCAHATARASRCRNSATISRSSMHSPPFLFRQGTALFLPEPPRL